MNSASATATVNLLRAAYPHERDFESAGRGNQVLCHKGEAVLF